MFIFDDFRQAWHGLAKSPAYLALAAGVLALGLGATIFMYGVVVTLVQKPPPFEAAERLYIVGAAEPARGTLDGWFAHPDFLDLRAQQHTLEDLAASNIGSITLSGHGLPTRLEGAWVSDNFFKVLHVKPALGRDFTPGDRAPNAERVVILGFNVWRTQFNSDPQVLGRSVRLGGEPATVIGVAPRGFSYPFTQEAWLTLPAGLDETERGTPNLQRHQLFGRLRDGVSAQQAGEDLAAITARLAEQYPDTNRGLTVHLMPIGASVVGAQGTRLVYVIFGCVWLVLLIACANVASLTFVRANLRIYEAGMRVALGASRGRLVAQMLSESMIVSLCAMLGGLTLAALALRGLKIGLPAMVGRPLPPWWEFGIDARVAAFSLGAALVCALIAGIVPALRASRPDVIKILRDGGRTGTGMRLGRFATVMVVVEIALSAVLLTAAGLLTRDALLSLQRDIGVDARGFMSARVGVPNYSHEERTQFFDRLLAQLAARPGVSAVAAASAMPGLGTDIVPYGIEGQSYAGMHQMPHGQDIVVAPGFFQAFGLKLLAGRDFDSRDRNDTLQVALVNEALARKHFGTADPLGRRIRLAAHGGGEEAWLTIVGVVPNVLHATEWAPGGQFHPTVYRPVSQERVFMTVALKGTAPPNALARALLESVQSLDADVAPFLVRTLEEQQAVARGTFRLLATLTTSFAIIAVVLAAVGIYGTLIFATRQRIREIGVRRALGAQDRQILALVMRSAMVQLAIGLTLAAILCPLMPRALAAALRGLPADDARIYTAVFGVLTLAVLAASWLPALRALKVQPTVALRTE